MSSETPPMTRTSTKYEDIPPRFRKLWIKGNAESVQKKLDTPIEGFSFCMPLQQSNSDTNLPKGRENRPSRSHSIGASGRISSSSSSLPLLHKRLRTGDPSLSETASNRSGGSGLLEKERDIFSVPIAYKGASSMQRIINSVVDTNVARSTPPTSRSNSPLGDLNSHNRYRPPSRSRPTTRSNSPNTGTRSLTPTPSGWIPLTSRHSLRRFDIRPWGPRHLEYDYNEARKEFQGAAYFALGQYGYVPPKGITKFKAPPSEELPSMSDLRKIPEFSKACRRLDAADRALEEALARGETWDNAPIPNEYLQFSLEILIPDDFCTRRPDNAVVQERSRSSVTLEEAAGQMKPASLSRSSTAAISAASSASASERGTDSMIVDEAQSLKGATSLAQMNLSDEQPPSSGSPFRPSTSTAIPDSTETRMETQDVLTPAETGYDSSVATSDVPPSQLVRKRLLEEIESDDELEEEKEKNSSSDTSGPSNTPTRTSSPAPAPATSERTARTSLGRAEAGSISSSGSGSGSGDETSMRESPPTSISTSISKRTSSEPPVGRVASMRGRKRGAGRR